MMENSIPLNSVQAPSLRTLGNITAVSEIEPSVTDLFG